MATHRTQEKEYVCPACGQTVSRFSVHVHNYNDAAHKQFVNDQRQIAIKLFETTELVGKPYENLHVHGLYFTHAFLKKTWVEHYGKVAVADRAQRLRVQHIAATIKSKHMHHTEEHKQKVSELMKQKAPWNRGLSKWLKRFYRDIAMERLGQTKIDEMKLMYTGYCDKLSHDKGDK